MFAVRTHLLMVEDGIALLHRGNVAVISTGGGRKRDPADAFAVAVTALGQENLRPVTAENQSTILRLLAERREDLGHERAWQRSGADRSPRRQNPKQVGPSCSG